jgi:hypothetical protein
MAFAVCDATGTIEITDRIPRGRIAFAKGERDKLVELVEGTCRLAYDNETFLIPGVPECGDDQRAACSALIAFRDRLAAQPDNADLVFPGSKTARG